jgi:hypothetical protein
VVSAEQARYLLRAWPKRTCSGRLTAAQFGQFLQRSGVARKERIKISYRSKRDISRSGKRLTTVTTASFAEKESAT